MIPTMMNILVIVISILSFAATAYGQGTLYFYNRIPPEIDAPVTDSPWGCRLSGTNFWAQLLVGFPGGALRPVGDPLPFRSGEAAGYIDISAGNADVVVPGFAGGTTVEVQVMAYWVPPGASPFGDTTGFLRGVSNKIRVTLGGGSPPLPPPNLEGLQPFSIVRLGDPGPPPTALALAPVVLGGDTRGEFKTFEPNQFFLSENPYFRSFFHTFTWQRRTGPTEWTTIAGENGFSIILRNVTSLDDYRVTATASCMTVTNTASLKIADRPRLAAIPGTIVDNSLTLVLSGEIGTSYQIETTTNLLDWMPFYNIMNYDNERAFFRAERGAGEQAKFYRAVVVKYR